jgi:hypothetical protein
VSGPRIRGRATALLAALAVSAALAACTAAPPAPTGTPDGSAAPSGTAASPAPTDGGADAVPTPDPTAVGPAGGAIVDSRSAPSAVPSRPQEPAPPARELVVIDGRNHWRFTTATGTASFAVPLDWRLEEQHTEVLDARGREAWLTIVRLLEPNGDTALTFTEGPRASMSPAGSPPSWDAGERRTVAGGLEAVSWSYASEYMGSPSREHGVGLTTAGATTLPDGSVCSGDMCRSFTGHQPSWYAGVTTAESWFSGELEERMLGVVASLELHHDDLTASPWE